MTGAVLFVFVVILVALVFELINGFHDAANSIATVVSTKVLTVNQGIIIAAVFELLGALIGTAVAFKPCADGRVVRGRIGCGWRELGRDHLVESTGGGGTLVERSWAAF